MDPFIGRQRELAILQQVYDSKRPELVAIYGRRRVGKTFLVQKFFSNKALFIEIVGARKAKSTEQLFNFVRVMEKIFPQDAPIDTPKNWSLAFDLLLQKLEKSPIESRIVLFFDELPWLAPKKSTFLSTLEYYWNRYFQRPSNHCSVVRICFILDDQKNHPQPRRTIWKVNKSIQTSPLPIKRN